MGTLRQSTLTDSVKIVSHGKLSLSNLTRGSLARLKDVRNSGHVYLKGYLEQKSARGQEGDESSRVEAQAGLHMSILDQIVLAQSQMKASKTLVSHSELKIGDKTDLELPCVTAGESGEGDALQSARTPSRMARLKAQQ